MQDQASTPSCHYSPPWFKKAQYFRMVCQWSTKTVRWAYFRNFTRWTFKLRKQPSLKSFSKLLLIFPQEMHLFTAKNLLSKINLHPCLDRLVQSCPCLEHEVSILEVYSKGFFPASGICRLSVWPSVHASARVANTWPWAGALVSLRGSASARRCTGLTFVRLWGAKRLGGGVNGLSRSSPRTAAGRSPSPSQGA